MRTTFRTTTAAGLFLSLILTGCGSSDSSKSADSGQKKSQSTSSDPSGTSGSTPSMVPKTASDTPSNKTVLTKQRTITGKLTPKSVDASGTGLVIANNMIYTHTVTLFDAATKQRIADIPDTVNLKDFGLSDTNLTLKGGPVEAAWTKDGKYAYVSNYVMDGPGYKDSPQDECTGKEHYKPSYIYRINVAEKKIDEVIAAGAVPKYVALTHDEKKLLVSNWCSYSLGVIDVASKKMTKQIHIAPWPRGIAVSPDDTYAYVAAYGTSNLYRVDLAKGTAKVFADVGSAARHVSLSPDGQYLYVVASHGNTVSKVDRETGKIVARTTGLVEPRSLTVSPDGKALYVVNYLAGTATKINAQTMEKLQTVQVGPHPIGITYEPRTGQVWVASYDGSIVVFDDNKTS